MINKVFNKNQIVSVTCRGEEICHLFTYKESQRGFLGFFRKEEGFYSSSIYTNSESLLDKIPSNLVKKGNHLYYRPSILIRYSNNEKEEIYFANEDEMNSYFRKNFYENIWRNK